MVMQSQALSDLEVEVIIFKQDPKNVNTKTIVIESINFCMGLLFVVDL